MTGSSQNIAVIGAGINGLAAALDRSAAQLLNGARDEDLADALESQAARGK